MKAKPAGIPPPGSGAGKRMKHFCATTILPLLILNALFTACSGKKEIILNKNELYTRALEESCTPVHPGIPGEKPFWNINATRFIYAPAFDFQESDQAVDYLFTVRSESDSTMVTFRALHPWHALSPVWKDIPPGYVHLVVEGIGKAMKKRPVRY